MRLFVAVELPSDIKEELVRLQSLLPEEIIRATNIHLTLKFLGDCDGAKVDWVKSTLDDVSALSSDAHLSDIGFFPSDSFIIVIWVGIQPEKEIKELQEKVDHALGNKFRKDLKFKAHLTLGRVKFLRDKQKSVQTMKKMDVKQIPFNIAEYTLFESVLGHPVKHLPLKKFRLE